MLYHSLTTEADPDIPRLMEAYHHPGVARYINLDEDNYWRYVTSNENVFYYKVYDEDRLVAAVHCELSVETLYMDIMVLPQYQRRGIGTMVLHDILSGNVIPCFAQIEVDIDESNTASLKLFEKKGFQFVTQEDELCHYVWQRFYSK